MKKALIIFVCFLVIMAILVGAGIVQDRGFFGNSNQLYDFVSPIFSKTEALFRAYFNTAPVVLYDDDLCSLHRVHFSSYGSDYYCDIIDLVVTLENNTRGGKAYISDTDYPNLITLERFTGEIIKLVDEDGNVLYNKRGIFASLSRDFVYITYGNYCEYVKGHSGRLKNLISEIPD